MIQPRLVPKQPQYKLTNTPTTSDSTLVDDTTALVDSSTALVGGTTTAITGIKAKVVIQRYYTKVKKRR